MGAGRLNAAVSSAGLFGRRIDDANAYYVSIKPNGHKAHSIQLFKRVAGEDVLLAQSDQNLANGDVVELLLTGSAKAVYVNGTMVASSSDDELTAAGTWGLFFGDYPGSGHTRNSWRLDISWPSPPTGARLRADRVAPEAAKVEREAAEPGEALRWLLRGYGSPLRKLRRCR